MRDLATRLWSRCLALPGLLPRAHRLALSLSFSPNRRAYTGVQRLTSRVEMLALCIHLGLLLMPKMTSIIFALDLCYKGFSTRKALLIL